eukprot:m.1374174 g.1374174  ORF g.1374174 m.1374174 type:complete len:1529 (-) comp24958_c0_seq31:1202-5788(-)
MEVNSAVEKITSPTDGNDTDDATIVPDFKSKDGPSGPSPLSDGLPSSTSGTATAPSGRRRRRFTVTRQSSNSATDGDLSASLEQLLTDGGSASDAFLGVSGSESAGGGDRPAASVSQTTFGSTHSLEIVADDGSVSAIEMPDVSTRPRASSGRFEVVDVVTPPSDVVTTEVSFPVTVPASTPVEAASTAPAEADKPSTPEPRVSTARSISLMVDDDTPVGNSSVRRGSSVPEHGRTLSPGVPSFARNLFYGDQSRGNESVFSDYSVRVIEKHKQTGTQGRLGQYTSDFDRSLARRHKSTMRRKRSQLRVSDRSNGRGGSNQNTITSLSSLQSSSDLRRVDDAGSSGGGSVNSTIGRSGDGHGAPTDQLAALRATGDSTSAGNPASKFLYYSESVLYAMLFSLGLLASFSDFLLEYITDEIVGARAKILTTNLGYGTRFFVWVLYTAVVLLIAIHVTFYMSPFMRPTRRSDKAVGTSSTPTGSSSFDNAKKLGPKLKRRSAATGGIPELKAILSGSALQQWLSLRMYSAKFVGMILALSSGMFIGKEGPFVHMACIIGHQLRKLLMWFNGSRNTDTKELDDQILQASAAVALGSAFRSPIGGMLFSVEVTAATYNVSNYKKGFFTAVIGSALVYLITSDTSGYRWSLAKDADINRTFTKGELFVFVLLGCFMGLLSTVFIWLYTRLRGFQKAIVGRLGWQTKPLHTGTAFGLVYGILTAVLQFSQGSYAEISLRKSVSDLWTEADLGRPANSSIYGQNWGKHYPVGFTCLLYSLTVFVMCALTLTLPIVAGLFTPTIAVGAGVGRAVGELMQWMFPSMKIAKSGYAYVGAAAFSSGVTHTISTCIAVLEMTGEMDYAIPMLLAVVLSVIISGRLSSSIFERISKLNNLPHIFIVRSDIGTKVAKDVMVSALDPDGNILWEGVPQIPVHLSLGQLLWVLLGAASDDTLDTRFRVPIANHSLIDSRRDDVISVVTPGEVRVLLGITYRVQLETIASTALRQALEHNSISNMTEQSRKHGHSFQRAHHSGSLRRRMGKTWQILIQNREHRHNNLELMEQIDLVKETCPDAFDNRIDLMSEDCMVEPPRLWVSSPVRSVVRAMLLQQTQYIMVTEFNGVLLGQVTIESLNGQLQEWAEAEQKAKKQERDTNGSGAGWFSRAFPTLAGCIPCRHRTPPLVPTSPIPPASDAPIAEEQQLHVYPSDIEEGLPATLQGVFPPHKAQPRVSTAATTQHPRARGEQYGTTCVSVSSSSDSDHSDGARLTSSPRRRRSPKKRRKDHDDGMRVSVGDAGALGEIDTGESGTDGSGHPPPPVFASTQDTPQTTPQTTVSGHSVVASSALVGTQVPVSDVSNAEVLSSTSFPPQGAEAGSVAAATLPGESMQPLVATTGATLPRRGAVTPPHEATATTAAHNTRFSVTTGAGELLDKASDVPRVPPASEAPDVPSVRAHPRHGRRKMPPIPRKPRSGSPLVLGGYQPLHGPPGETPLSREGTDESANVSRGSVVAARRMEQQGLARKLGNREHYLEILHRKK